MEFGYFHPDRGYWQTTGEPSQRILDSYPEGTVEVPLKPGPYHEWDGSSWVDMGPPPPNPSDVNRERERRIIEGRVFTLSTGQSIHVTGRDEDIRNLTNLALGAQVRIGQGDVETITDFRDETNTVFRLTPVELLELWQLATEYVSAIYRASWVLKDNPEGIPADYTSDRHWST